MMAAALRCGRRFLLQKALLTSATAPHPFWKPLIAEGGLRASKCGTNLHSCNFSSKGRKKSKSDSSQESGDEILSEKEAALEATLNQIAKDFGKETVMWLGRTSGTRHVPVISTGSVGLDVALGVGGLPKGRVVEIYGPEASGKTTLALHAIAEAQKNGGYCVFVDAEHSLDPTLAEAIGVDTKNLLLAQPDCGEQALGLVDTFIRSGSIDVIVVDSVAALVPKTELDGEVGDTHVALQARLMSQCLRKLTHALSCSQTLLIFINQVRAKLGGFGFGTNQILKEANTNIDGFVFNNPDNLNARCKSLKDTCQVFDEIPEWGVASWNTMTYVHMQSGDDVEACKVCFQMRNLGSLDLKETTHKITSVSFCSFVFHRVLSSARRRSKALTTPRASVFRPGFSLKP